MKIINQETNYIISNLLFMQYEFVKLTLIWNKVKFGEWMTSDLIYDILNTRYTSL
jgi:hypothetical protein